MRKVTYKYYVSYKLCDDCESTNNINNPACYVCGRDLSSVGILEKECKSYEVSCPRCGMPKNKMNSFPCYACKKNTHRFSEEEIRSGHVKYFSNTDDYLVKSGILDRRRKREAQEKEAAEKKAMRDARRAADAANPMPITSAVLVLGGLLLVIGVILYGLYWLVKYFLF